MYLEQAQTKAEHEFVNSFTAGIALFSILPQAQTQNTQTVKNYTQLQLTAELQSVTFCCFLLIKTLTKFPT
jgi:hypothetical protein